MVLNLIGGFSTTLKSFIIVNKCCNRTFKEAPVSIIALHVTPINNRNSNCVEMCNSVIVSKGPVLQVRDPLLIVSLIVRDSTRFGCLFTVSSSYYRLKRGLLLLEVLSLPLLRVS